MRRERWTTFLAPAGCLALLGLAAGASAQPVTLSRFDFSFSNPGARSLGFGGAFAALADDATAAYANPAGLVQLAEPEVSLEMRMWRRSPPHIAGGRVDGTPTGQGIDTHVGPLFQRNHSQDFGPSFASVVLPKGRWSFAFYGHRLAQFEDATTSQGVFSGRSRSPALRETVDLSITSAGGAAGWRMTDRFSLGLGLVISDVSLRMQSSSYLPDGQDRFGPATFLPSLLVSTSRLTAEGTDVTLHAGVLARFGDQLTGSLFYRQGPEVDGGTTVSRGPSFPGPPSRNRAAFEVPDVAGAGLAWRLLGGSLTLATEVDYVGYAGMLRGSSTVPAEHNAWEFHVGAEYALLRRSPILAVRAGTWIEKELVLFFPKEITHYSLGLGLAAPPWQLDLAGDVSDNAKTASLSAIYTF
ncbi:MAG TPA: hypothetical protein DD490_16305 [Acidobacteria bacterium]|nr:hypothetical protein [Acidobacteriota bacterium]